MTDEKKDKVTSWMGSWGAATIVLLSGFVVIGSYKADVDTLKKITEKTEALNQAQEQRITRLEVAIDNFKEGQNEIRKDIKILLSERRRAP